MLLILGQNLDMDNDNKEIKEEKVLKLVNEKGALSIVSPFLGFIISHWGFILVIGLLTSMYGEWKALQYYRTHYIDEKAVATQLAENLKKANSALDDQNAIIEKAAKDSLNKKTQIDALTKKLTDKGIADQKIIDALRNKPSPQTCQAVETDIDEFIRKISW